MCEGCFVFLAPVETIFCFQRLLTVSLCDSHSPAPLFLLSLFEKAVVSPLEGCLGTGVHVRLFSSFYLLLKELN